MNPSLLSALFAPAAVAVAAGIVWAVGGPAGAVVVLGIGWGALLVIHIRNLDRLTRWAESPTELPVPEGSGPWRAAFSGLYRRVRLREAHQRDLGRTIERFQSAAEAIPDGMVVLDRQNRVKWANIRARAHLGLDERHDIGSPLMNIVRQPEFVRFLESRRFRRADHDRVAARGRPHARHPDRALRHGGAPADQPRHHPAGGGGAHAPRLHRQCLARTEDAADGHRRFPGDAAGAEASTRSSASASSS